MTINAAMVWEVRTGGVETNGGGFKDGASGTDYTQQDAAQLSLTDGATSGIGVTTFTSVAGGFTAAMIGNVLNLASGTNVTAGFYEITAHTDTNTITLDRAPDDGVGGVSGGVGSIGGGLLTPGRAAEACMAATTAEGNLIWVKAGTYTTTTTTQNVSGGPVLADWGAITTVACIFGYETTRGDYTGTRPVLVAHAGSMTLWSSGTYFVMFNLEADGNGQASLRGFFGASRGAIIGSVAEDCSNNGFFGNIAQNVIAYCSGTLCTGDFAFDSGLFYKCRAYSNLAGGIKANNAIAIACLSDDNTGNGFSGGTVFNVFLDCTAHGNTTDGISLGSASEAVPVFVNCLLTSNLAKGIDVASGRRGLALNCVGLSNSSGNGFPDMFTDMNIGEVTITGDPYESAAGDDYRPDNTANEGAELRAAGLSIPTQVDQDDIGAVQHADPVGGGAASILGGGNLEGGFS